MSEMPRVGCLYPYFPPEILHALGRVPVLLLPEAHDLADAEPYLHKNFCSLSKAILSRFVDGDTPTGFEGVIFADVCDAQRCLYDVWRGYANVPVLTRLDVPRRADALGQDYFYGALARCVSELETRFGETLTADSLANSIRLYNRQRELVSALRSAWLAGRVATDEYLSLRDMRLTSDPVFANSEIESALAQATEKQNASAHSKPRLLLMGSLNVHRGLMEAIQADARAQIVAEDSACDERQVRDAIPVEGSREDMLHALASQYSSLPAPRMRDLPRRLAYLQRLVEARGVNGVICSYYKFCDLYLAEFPIVKRFFEQRGIRVLLLEDEGEAAFSGQARTRLQAFLEMLADD